MQLVAFANNQFSLGNVAMLVNEGLVLYIVDEISAKHNLSQLRVGLRVVRREGCPGGQRARAQRARRQRSSDPDRSAVSGRSPAGLARHGAPRAHRPRPRRASPRFLNLGRTAHSFLSPREIPQDSLLRVEFAEGPAQRVPFVER